MKSVNKVFLLGHLTRDPELKRSEGKSLSVSLVWQRTEAGQLRPEKSGRKPSSTGLLLGISWLRRVSGISKRAERPMLKDDYKLVRIPDKTG